MVVTTPQKLAFVDVAKGIRMFAKLQVRSQALRVAWHVKLAFGGVAKGVRMFAKLQVLSHLFRAAWLRECTCA